MMTALLALLGQYKFYIFGGIAVIVGLLLLRSHWKNEGRQELQAEIENAPIRSSDTVTVRDTIFQKVQVMSGIGQRRRGGDLVVLAPEPQPILDTGYCRELFLNHQKLLSENDILKQEVSIILSDSLGGKHEIKYMPAETGFTEKYSPPPLFREQTTITNTKVVFEKHFLSIMPLVSYRDEPSYGGLVSFDKIVVGGLFGKSKPQWIAGIKIEF